MQGRTIYLGLERAVTASADEAEARANLSHTWWRLHCRLCACKRTGRDSELGGEHFELLLE
jgi:hypothetical protein